MLLHISRCRPHPLANMVAQLNALTIHHRSQIVMGVRRVLLPQQFPTYLKKKLRMLHLVVKQKRPHSRRMSLLPPQMLLLPSLLPLLLPRRPMTDICGWRGVGGGYRSIFPSL